MSVAATPGRSRTLRVPYFVQPTGITCQSTCLKMFAAYLEKEVLFQSTGAAAADIAQIWKDINQSADRPVQLRNAHANLKWWLEKHFSGLQFEYLTFTDQAEAKEQIVSFVDGGMPVLMSVSHARVPGHIVLVVGYRDYHPRQSSPGFSLVVHDPYGSFDPSLLSTLFGAARHTSGMSLATGGEIGPGMNCLLPLAAVSRQRANDAQRGRFYMLSARR